MGLELTYQAIPDDSRLFEMVAISPDHGEALRFIKMYLSGSRNADGNEIDRMFYDEAQQIKVTHPGIELRTCSLDRWWDNLYFLLSENRRNVHVRADDFGSEAIRGERDVHKYAVATQGAPLRFVSGPHAIAIASWMNAINYENLKSQYNPALIESQHVYKFSKDRTGEEEFCIIWKYFEDLRTFYQSIADRHEGALLILD
jgi:hypothetical protein